MLKIVLSICSFFNHLLLIFYSFYRWQHFFFLMRPHFWQFFYVINREFFVIECWIIFFFFGILCNKWLNVWRCCQDWIFFHIQQYRQQRLMDHIQQFLVYFRDWLVWLIFINFNLEIDCNWLVDWVAVFSMGVLFVLLVWSLIDFYCWGVVIDNIVLNCKVLVVGFWPCYYFLQIVLYCHCKSMECNHSDYCTNFCYYFLGNHSYLLGNHSYYYYLGNHSYYYYLLGNHFWFVDNYYFYCLRLGFFNCHIESFLNFLYYIVVVNTPHYNFGSHNCSKAHDSWHLFGNNCNLYSHFFLIMISALYLMNMSLHNSIF